MYLDLRELSKEYADLKDLKEDEADGGTLTIDETERLALLQKLDDDLNGLDGYSRLEPTAIPENEFKQYAEDYARDVGYLSDSETNPLFYYIDWEQWADDMVSDYTEFEFDGETYLVKAY